MNSVPMQWMIGSRITPPPPSQKKVIIWKETASYRLYLTQNKTPNLRTHVQAVRTSQMSPRS